jgi:GTPase SAR1 family protein
MGRCAVQIVMGPAGSGKSTYCHAMQEHCDTTQGGKRTVHVGNLDPACDTFSYTATFDVQELISVEDVMSELGLGPNGGLMYAMEYLLDNMDWLENELNQFGDDDYLILDCPGQIELYTHVPIMKRIMDRMKEWGFDMVSVFCVDSAFLVDASKFLAGSLLSLTAMIALELPHVNVLTKCDLMSPEEVDSILDQTSAMQVWDKEQTRQSLIAESASDEERTRQAAMEKRRRQRGRLTDAISQLLDDYQMVSFVPLNIKDEDSMEHVLATVDHAIQYGEDLEVRETDFETEYTASGNQEY